MTGVQTCALPIFYGSCVGNGVILITTKSGRKTEGLGITISGTISAETIFMSPKMQNSFGQGSNETFDKDSGSSWGPKITGQEYTNWNNQKVHMRSFDNVDNYFKTGINLTETFSFTQQYNKTAIYTSLTRMDDNSKIPSSKLKRTSLTARATTQIGRASCRERV